jgi:DNA polymerase III subunit gamma/tau
MENFVVSARKYRPAVFSHVLGQEPITTTLKNAIKDKHLAQAFLFCGPRGVGKTTCARILAKAINCQQLTTNIEPCNTCDSCTNFNQQRSFNIYELDAASNNSVEDIRSLVEQVRYPPQVGQYKVYIIDEVHMLSQAAFNAFLKTLEEPPSYVIFILATTEKHKVIPTILSRCQIFDFQRIQPQAIVQQLKIIAEQENIAYEEEGLHLISQKADGALRDALAMFDLIVTFGSGKLTHQAALENLHVLDYTYYFKLIDALLQGKVPNALLLYDEILRTGFDNLYFISGLSEHLRNLLVCQDQATLPLLEIPPSIQFQYHDQAKKATPTFLLKALQIVNQYDIHYKSSHNKRLHLELCLIELAQINGSILTNRDLDPTPITPQPTYPTPEQPALSTIQPLAIPQPVKTPKEPITQEEVKNNSSTKHSYQTEPAQINGSALTNRDLDPTLTTPQPISPTPEQPTPSIIQPLATPQPVRTPKEPIAQEEVKNNSSTKHSYQTEPAQIDGSTLNNRDLDLTPTTPQPTSPTPEQPALSTIQPLAIPQPVRTPKEPITQEEVKNNSSTKHSHPGKLQTTIKLPQLEQLKAYITQSHQDSKQPIATAIEERAFNKELLLSVWKKYAEKLKEDGKLPAYRLLDQDIELDGTTILLQFTNAVQEDILTNIKENLLTYLRTEMQYASLDIKGTLIQETKINKPYTAQEKFNYLAQKNPHLQFFQKKLNLLVVD